MEYIMETHDLVKSYKNRNVVDSVNIHVKKGEIYGFVGPNGAGKSTVMKMLLNLTYPDSGEVYIFGEKIGNKSFECLKRIGSIIESPCFYEKITGRQNLELHCEYMGFHNKERIEEVLQLVDLQNIDGKFVSHYSMGMKQRLAIARAILTKPEFLVLDEPINALDPEGIREIRKCQADYIELEADDMKRTGYLLERELGLTDFKVITDTKVEIYDLGKSVGEISAVLVKNGIGIISIGMKQNSLEDYFFHVVREV